MTQQYRGLLSSPNTVKKCLHLSLLILLLLLCTRHRCLPRYKLAAPGASYYQSKTLLGVGTLWALLLLGTLCVPRGLVLRIGGLG